MIDNTKSIEQLENDFWKDNDPPTRLVEKCSQLRKIPIQNLTIEQIRLLIGQNIGLPFLIPKTIYILKSNIFAEGDLYEGDLLKSVLDIKEDFWESHLDLKSQLRKIVADKIDYIERKNENNIHRQLLKSIHSFLQN